MAARVETGISPTSPLYYDLIKHFHEIQNHLDKINVWHAQPELHELLTQLEVKPLPEVLQSSLEQPISRIGTRLRRPEGIIYQIEADDGSATFFKLYDGAGVDPSMYAPTLLRLFPPQRRIRRILGFDYVSRDPVPLEVLEILGGMKQEGKGSYFASAEILVRTYAHHAAPDQIPLPVVIINDKQSAVGFTLLLPRPVASAANPLREETFFDLGPVAYRWRDDVPTAPELRARLKPYNVHVYDETIEDIEKQVLRDATGKFLTFARLGYRR